MGRRQSASAQPSSEPSEALSVESFRSVADGIERTVRLRDGSRISSEILGGRDGGRIGRAVDVDEAEGAFLRMTTAPLAASEGNPVRVVDLFSGCGGITLGVSEAARAVGRSCDVRLAVDFEPSATTVFAKNFPGTRVETADVREFLPGAHGDRLVDVEKRVRKRVGEVDLLVGGPPCQGHSDLNNRTRRSDSKNALYLSMVRAAEVFEPSHILIENVPGAINDRSRVVQRSMSALERLGYEVSYDVVDMTRIGVPQRRKRLIVLASRSASVDLSRLYELHGIGERGVRWAIGDLVDAPTDSLLDQPARSAPDTVKRIQYLFENQLWELPNSERPPCHSSGGHSYSSIYGRLRWDTPSQTITTGFYSMCMGRYVHPSERRTLTAHEAARLQYFPDFFDFSSVTKRSELARLIGNAVPMKLSYVIALELFR